MKSVWSATREIGVKSRSTLYGSFEMVSGFSVNALSTTM
jgi:hypothetical protein